MLSEKDLIGTWRLISHFYFHEDGSTSEGPLGIRADGLLIYDAHGYMSVGMMRTDPVIDNGSASSRPPVTYMGYSGRWRLTNSTVVHEVEISSHFRIVKTKQIREARLNDDRLILRECLDGSPWHFVLNWRRA